MNISPISVNAYSNPFVFALGARQSESVPGMDFCTIMFSMK